MMRCLSEQDDGELVMAMVGFSVGTACMLLVGWTVRTELQIVYVIVCLKLKNFQDSNAEYMERMGKHGKY